MTVCTKRFDTPFGYIEVLQNGIPVEFEITSEINGYDRVWIDDETVLYPDGLYEIIIPIEKTNPGDVYIVRYSSGELEYDGGDEHTLNALPIRQRRLWQRAIWNMIRMHIVITISIMMVIVSAITIMMLMVIADTITALNITVMETESSPVGMMRVTTSVRSMS